MVDAKGFAEYDLLTKKALNEGCPEPLFWYTLRELADDRLVHVLFGLHDLERLEGGGRLERKVIIMRHKNV